MKTNRSNYVSSRMVKQIFKILFSFVLFFTGLLIVKDGNHQVYAANLEDCDLDGFDDATGVPVPWPGYDETKGDTPDGPGGSKSSGATSGSTNKNNDTNAAGSEGGSAEGTASSTTNNTADTSTKKAADSTADSATNKTKNSVKNNITNSKLNSKSNNTANTTTSGSTTSNNPGSTASENTKSESSKKDSSKLNKNSSNGTTGTTENTASDKSSTVAADKPSSETTEKTETETASDTDSSEVIAESSESEVIQDSDVTTESSESAEVELTDFSEVYLDSIIDTKGILDITETAGSLFHAGSTISITGSGFKENIENLEIELHSVPQPLGVVTTNEEGSFDLQVSLPENLEPGIHQIVVLYQGVEVVRQQIEVGSKPADSFLQALLVGFTSENKGLIPGLAILGGLFALGVAAVIMNELVRLRRAKKQLLV